MLFAPGIICGGWLFWMKIAYTQRHGHSQWLICLRTLPTLWTIEFNWTELNFNQMCILLDMLNEIYLTSSVSLFTLSLSLPSLCLLSTFSLFLSFNLIHLIIFIHLLLENFILNWLATIQSWFSTKVRACQTLILYLKSGKLWIFYWGNGEMRKRKNIQIQIIFTVAMISLVARIRTLAHPSNVAKNRQTKMKMKNCRQ